MSWFSGVVRAESDKIYGVQEAYVGDKRDDKINLSIGVYRDERGKPFIPPSVVKCEQMLIKQNPHKEYAPIEGFADFRQTVASFIFGEQSDVIGRTRHATVQGLGGTGSLRIGAIFLYELQSHSKKVYIPEQTWSAHNQVFSHSGFVVNHYRYWNSSTLSLDFNALMEDMETMIEYSVVVLHSTAHNPTGNDPTLDEWQQIIRLMKRRHLFPFLDCAYQGFTSGSVEEDTRVIRLFAEQMDELVIAFTFSKNMGLYGERIGAMSVVCRTSEEADNVLTQLKRIIRPIYSHPPNWGARLVTLLLNDHQLKKEWFNDVKNMQTRISDIRSQLVQELNRLSKGKYVWDFLLKQRGMFGFTGFTERQAIQLRHEFAIYIATDGRINIAAINDTNIKKIANALHSIKTNG